MTADTPPVSIALMEAAVSLAHEGAVMARDAYENNRSTVAYKSDGSVVTDTDRAVESMLVGRITSLFPDDAVLGEEHGGRGGTSGRRWIIDPIDGTESFVHGVGEWCTMVAVEDEAGVLAGVIDIPVLGEAVWAGRGRGAFLNGSPIAVGEATDPQGAYVATSDLDDWPDHVLAAARRAGLRPRTWGGGYGVGLTVSGRVDAFVDYDVDVWDVAPAAILASEAGGCFRALDGSSELDRGTCVVTNMALLDAMLEIFSEA